MTGRETGGRRSLPGEGTNMSGVEQLAEQLAMAHGRALKAEAEVERLRAYISGMPYASDLEGAVAEARADQREATIRYAAEWLRTLGRDDMAVALVRALSVVGGQ